MMLTWEILKSFEFNKVVEHLSSFISCSATKEELSVHPSFVASEITILLRHTAEFQEMTKFDGDLNLEGLPDLRAVLEVLKIPGSTLSIESLVQLWRFFALCGETVRFLRERKVAEKYVSLWNDYLEKIKDFTSLRKKVEKIISPDGYVLDTASDHLYQLRRKIKMANERIEETLNEFLQSSKVSSFLQEKMYTIRKDRYVVPVKIQHRHAVDGMVVDYSSSGSTVFIEPKVISRLNNELELLRHLEQEEITRILYRITSELRSFVSDISLAFSSFMQLDLLRAKVKLGETWEGIVPRVGGEELIIRGGRHPLLGKKAIPFDLSLSPAKKILVVSGPNAGGKTVLLKSLALIISLTFCGIPVPLQAGSAIPFYEDLFVDIGDHQDIENELSTFTSRTRNLAEALARDCSRVLFLIDELGAGTDPNEGTALAIATLKYLQKKGAMCVVTTHLPVLKYRASQEEGMSVASLAINPDTFEPTYRLVLGEIGASYGVKISERVGLPKEIIDDAMQLLSAEEIQLNDLIVALTKERNSLSKITEENILKMKELEQKEQEIAEKMERLQKREKALLREFKQELEEYLSKTKDEISQIVGKLRREKQLNQEEYERWKERMREEEKKVQAMEETLVEIPSGDAVHFQEGDVVLVDFLNQTGTVISLDEKRKNALVNIAGRKIKVSMESLRRIGAEDKISLPSSFPRFVTPVVRNEIEIRALTRDEALEKLEQYFDRVVLAGFTTVYVIHGKGEGILRELTHEFLRRHPYVESFRLGYPEEGGLGVTVVTLKS
ncbi:MAG: endonuclease MutS2 [Atribacterota bacterium]|nr:endonuclease MutS2 [Atribacterota bacterium]